MKACDFFATFAKGAQGKREVAAFFANVSQETTGLKTIDNPLAGLCFINEDGCFNLGEWARDPQNYKGVFGCGGYGGYYFGRGAI